jgi:hypothetical protein
VTFSQLTPDGITLSNPRTLLVQNVPTKNIPSRGQIGLSESSQPSPSNHTGWNREQPAGS